MKARRVKKLDPEAPLVETAARIVRVRLDELRSFAPQALEREGVSEQHDMRIAAKRLRYVLEITESCFGRPAVSARRRARELQGLLGDMHDCDMTIPVVQAQLDDLRRSDAEALRRRAGDDPDLDPSVARSAPSRTSYRGLEVLIVYLQARRGHLFEHFRDFWIAQEKAGTWNRLERAAEHQLELAKERRRAEREAEQAREELEQAELAEREARERAARAQAELERTSLSG